MKNIFAFALLILSFISCAQNEKSAYTQEIEQYRMMQNVQFSNRNTSPLKAKDLKNFRSLDFFPIDTIYKVTAALELTPNMPVFEMQTTTNDLRHYAQYAIAHFTINGKKLQLSIYQSKSIGMDPTFKSHFFLPFNDLTNGNETYGAGRYLDIEINNDKTIILDFNKAYNPYCAYNDGYSCPIPPKENYLQAEIKAGAKAFKKK